MNLETFSWLLTAEGQALLTEAMAGDLREPARLQELERLRRLAPPERAAAAYEIARLRGRAAAKFERAVDMYFTREALEQASGEVIAGYRSARYRPFTRVADLCCGAGGDTLALAGVARVVAVDRDPLRLAMAAANARALGLSERVEFARADLGQDPPPLAEAIFFDPGRRSGGRRVFALAEYEPPVTLVREWRERTPAIGVKVAPGVSDEELAELGVPEVEFISVDGELKEAVLWFGPLAGDGRRASVLRTIDDGRSTTDRAQYKLGGPRPVTSFSMLNAQFSTQARLAEPQAYLYEPDPAIMRARAVALLAEQIGAAQLDREIAYLTSDRLVATPLARAWRVLEWQPFGLKRLRARLREFGAGAVTVKKRGSPLDAEALARQLSGRGERPLVVVLTQVSGRPTALICEGPVG